MSQLEVIRPFETPLPLNQDRVVPSVVKQAAQVSQLIWGKVGKLPAPIEENPAFMSFKVINPGDQDLAETTRQSQNVRVQNPNDSTQYVEVARVQNITFRGGSSNQPIDQYTAYEGGTGQSGQTNYTYTLNWPTS